MRAEETAYSTFVVPVDDLVWTKHWLGRFRCDQLMVSIARREDVSPKIVIRAVESKSSSSIEPVEPRPETEPFAEGCAQVVATLDALWELVDPDADTQLVEDLRFSSFCEHLASVALSSLYPLSTRQSEDLVVLQNLSEFSRRGHPAFEVSMDGAVVCTQYRTAAPRQALEIEADGAIRPWRVFLVRAGTLELEQLLGAETTSFVVKVSRSAEGQEPATDTSDAVRTVSGSLDHGEPAREDEPGGEENGHEGKPPEPPPVEPDPTTPVTGAEPVDESSSETKIANDLYLASIQRGFRVERPEESAMVVGPSLIAVPMALQAGASIRPIESALDDLAREVGVNHVYVENDPTRAFHVRFMVPRPDRMFPELPDQLPPLVDVESQAYVGVDVGQTLEGGAYATFLSSWPHMLVGGTTGSGKTTFLRSILRQLARMRAPEIKVVVVDGKGEIDYINVVPVDHFVPEFPDVILGHQDALPVFDWIVESEIPRRRAIILERARASQESRPKQARELYVESAKSDNVEPFPPIVVLLDEFAELMLAGGQTAQRFEQRVQQVTQVGRSSLVHLVLATQRPDASVVSGAIKANLDARVALRLPTHHDSMTILGGGGAEKLLGRGDLLFRSAGHSLIRLQGFAA